MYIISIIFEEYLNCVYFRVQSVSVSLCILICELVANIYNYLQVMSSVAIMPKIFNKIYDNNIKDPYSHSTVGVIIFIAEFLN